MKENIGDSTFDPIDIGVCLSLHGNHACPSRRAVLKFRLFLGLLGLK